MKVSLVALAFAAAASARKMTVYNACPFAIWPAMFTDMAVSGNQRPTHTTGWKADPWTSRTFDVPEGWKAGRIWGRRNCGNFNLPAPTQQCLTGGCNGGLVCNLQTGTGVPPATLAEFTLSGGDGLDYYDISLVDGYNLPMKITNNKGCPQPNCNKDLGPGCPAALKGPFDSAGFPVGCKSACFANLDGNPGNSKNCCSGQYNRPQTCPVSGVQHYSYFKNGCRDAYAYAYDESSESALWTCPTRLKADFTITFCP
ncbi:thaumatin-like protein [Pterulicium gracile]|uniref:Thaumatin-like protein n=1 Tax=Pterulicium gracile TaxID=1884261 RepID=A0A5C3Q5Q6_9AGAR|nr:thaumatin-like protein [Pterula gracilis]